MEQEEKEKIINSLMVDLCTMHHLTIPNQIIKDAVLMGFNYALKIQK